MGGLEKKAIDDKLAAGEKKLSAEQKAAEEKYKGELKANADKADKANKAIAKEAKDNASHAKAVMDKIDKDAAAAKAKLDGKIASEKKAKAKAAVAAKNEKIDEGKMKKAAAKEADAKKAKAHAKEVNVKDAATEVKTKAKTKEISHKDGEIGMCNGHRCQSADGKCHGVLPYDKSSKLYLGEDLVHCTTKEPKDGPIGSDAETNSAGLSWSHAETPTPPPTPAASSSECLANVATFKKTYGSVPSTSSVSAVACSGPQPTTAKTEPAAKAKTLAFLKIKSTCPKACNGYDSVVDKDGKTTTTGICITPEDYKGIMEQLESVAVYSKSGTGGRFAAGIGMRACRMACNSEAGWASAAGLPIPGASPLCKGKDFKRKRLASRVGLKGRL